MPDNSIISAVEAVLFACGEPVGISRLAYAAETEEFEIQNIIDECSSVFENYDVEFCYLFGSYAKGRATETSDVDLLICTEERGLKYFGLVEDLRNALNKKIDALDIKQLNNNPELLREILRDGIKIYG